MIFALDRRVFLLSFVGMAIVTVTTALAATAENDPTPTQVRANLAALGLAARLGDRAFRNTASSMEPTLHCARPQSACEGKLDDRVMVRPYAAQRGPARGDIVAFRAPTLAATRCGAGGTFLKRVVGLPGEQW